MKTSVAGSILAAAALSLLLVGCVQDTALAPAPSPTAKAPEPIETPTPTPTPEAIACDNILSSDTLALLAADGFIVIEGHEQDLRAEQRVEARFFDNGGVDCLWGIAQGGDSMAVFGYSEIADSDAVDVQNELIDLGYLMTAEGTDVIYEISPADDVLGHGDMFLFESGAWYHANQREWIDDIRETVG